MRSSIKIVMVSLVTLMSAACTGSRDPASSKNAVAAAPAIPASDQQPAVAANTAVAPILDACSLISQTDADGILGTPAMLAEHMADDKDESHCQYNAANQATKGFNSLIVKIHTDEDSNEARAGFAIQQKMAAANAYEPLTGIGDGAFLVINKPPEGAPVDMMQDAQTLYLIKGAKDIMVSTQYTGKPRSADSLKALAKKLADHF